MRWKIIINMFEMSFRFEICGKYTISSIFLEVLEVFEVLIFEYIHIFTRLL